MRDPFPPCPHHSPRHAAAAGPACAHAPTLPTARATLRVAWLLAMLMGTMLLCTTAPTPASAAKAKEQPAREQAAKPRQNATAPAQPANKQLVAGQPDTEPVALWKYITKTSPFRKWAQFPDHKGKQEGFSPHGAKHVVYANEAAQTSHGQAKPGSIIVKESFTTSGRTQEITVMYKVAGFNPAAGDWYWAEYTDKGVSPASGTPANCINCHSPVKGNDYVFTHRW